MSLQPQQKQSDIVKILERQNVISFKKKPKLLKDNLKSQNNNQDEDNISAQSSHSGVYSQDINRFKGKINPLPELGKEKYFKNQQRKRFISKNLLAQQFRINNYQQKEVRQQQNLMLKQKNNFLSSENMKLKTKISTLEKENIKLQKMLEQQPLKPKTPGISSLTKERFRASNQNLSTKIIIKGLKKELEDLKKQNNNIKSSIKFTTISELECQRDAILEQTSRLRAMLEQEQNRRISMKINQQGMSNLEQRLGNLQQKNSILMRENNELKNKLKAYEQGQHKASKSSQNQKNLSKTLYTVRRLLKEKQKEVEQLRQQIKTAGSIQSFGVGSDKSINNQPVGNVLTHNGVNGPRKPSMERPNPISKNFDKRIVSKSAQKNGPKANNEKLSERSECQNCKGLRSQNEILKKKLAEYESVLQVSNPLVIPTDPVERPKEGEIQALTRFVEYRFKAHHLGLNESQKYLLNSENISEEQLKKQVTVQQFLQILVTEPFVVLNKRYIEVFLLEICYGEEIKKGSQKIKIEKDFKITKKTILENYKKLMPPFELLPQVKQEEMFLQIAQLVTSYYQQILAAMSNRKNGEGTIAQKDLTEFFVQIELEKEYIDFIITQIILESIDLERLNYFAFFEIFYIPQEEGETCQNTHGAKKLSAQGAVDKKKRFQVDHVVKQEDEEYQESRSHVDQSRQKTLSKHGQEQGDSYHQINIDDSPIKKEQNEQNYEEQNQQYGEQQYEQDRNDQKPSPVVQSMKSKTIEEKKDRQKQKPKEKKKKTQKDESYAEEFQQERMGQEVEEDQKPVSKKETKGKQMPKQLVQKPYEIEDIEDEYQEQFQN